MSDDPEDIVVHVRLLDKDYSIRSSEGDKVRRIADYLNDQIDKVRSGAPSRNIIDLAVMAAFRAAGDYFSAAEELEALKKQIERRAEELSARIERHFPE